MRTDCIVKLSKLQISELNTLVQKETSGHVEGNHLLRTVSRAKWGCPTAPQLVHLDWKLLSYTIQLPGSDEPELKAVLAVEELVAQAIRGLCTLSDDAEQA
jgi:hypothetical protein